MSQNSNNISINIIEDNSRNIMGLDYSLFSFINMPEYITNNIIPDSYTYNSPNYEFSFSRDYMFDDVLISMPLYNMTFSNYNNIIEDEMLQIAQNESLDYYNTQEKKPGICIDENIKQTEIDNILFYKLSEDECSICRDNFELNQHITELDCKHILHTECISEWVKYKSECPVCRNDINTYEKK